MGLSEMNHSKDLFIPVIMNGVISYYVHCRIYENNI